VAVLAEHPRAGRWAKPVSRSALHFLGALGLKGVELSIALTSDGAIRGLNRRWRRKDKATDVLSFPAGETPAFAGGSKLLGDVIISLDTAIRCARQERRSVNAELERYLAHGLLHLLGHDHHRPDEARKMACLERALLGGRGMVPF
jgi:probable rRNA maturation factor